VLDLQFVHPVFGTLVSVCLSALVKGLAARGALEVADRHRPFCIRQALPCSTISDRFEASRAGYQCLTFTMPFRVLVIAWPAPGERIRSWQWRIIIVALRFSY
jgi:hypothetical protein